MDIENKWGDTIERAKVAVPVLEIEFEGSKSGFKDPIGKKNWKVTGPVIHCVYRNVEGWCFVFQNSKTDGLFL